MENSIDEVTENIESEDEGFEVESNEEDIDEEDMTDIQEDIETINVSSIDDQKIFFNNYLIDLKDIPNLKKEYLSRYAYNEILGILLNTHSKLQNGASIILDEIEFKKLTNENFYNNYDIINEKTASIISIILKCMPIHVEKNNKIFNRFDDEITNVYIYHIKSILLVLFATECINYNIIKKLFPILYKNLYLESVTEEEIVEIKRVKQLLLK